MHTKEGRIQLEEFEITSTCLKECNHIFVLNSYFYTMTHFLLFTLKLCTIFRQRDAFTNRIS